MKTYDEMIRETIENDDGSHPQQLFNSVSAIIEQRPPADHASSRVKTLALLFEHCTIATIESIRDRITPWLLDGINTLKSTSSLWKPCLRNLIILYGLNDSKLNPNAFNKLNWPTTRKLFLLYSFTVHNQLNDQQIAKLIYTLDSESFANNKQYRLLRVLIASSLLKKHHACFFWDKKTLLSFLTNWIFIINGIGPSPSAQKVKNAFGNKTCTLLSKATIFHNNRPNNLLEHITTLPKKTYNSWVSFNNTYNLSQCLNLFHPMLIIDFVEGDQSHHKGQQLLAQLLRTKQQYLSGEFISEPKMLTVLAIARKGASNFRVLLNNRELLKNNDALLLLLLLSDPLVELLLQHRLDHHVDGSYEILPRLSQLHNILLKHDNIIDKAWGTFTESPTDGYIHKLSKALLKLKSPKSYLADLTRTPLQANRFWYILFKYPNLANNPYPAINFIGSRWDFLFDTKAYDSDLFRLLLLPFIESIPSLKKTTITNLTLLYRNVDFTTFFQLANLSFRDKMNKEHFVINLLCEAGEYNLLPELFRNTGLNTKTLSSQYLSFFKLYCCIKPVNKPGLIQLLNAMKPYGTIDQVTVALDALNQPVSGHFEENCLQMLIKFRNSAFFKTHKALISRSFTEAMNTLYRKELMLTLYLYKSNIKDLDDYLRQHHKQSITELISNDTHLWLFIKQLNKHGSKTLTKITPESYRLSRVLQQQSLPVIQALDQITTRNYKKEAQSWLDVTNEWTMPYENDPLIEYILSRVEQALPERRNLHRNLAAILKNTLDITYTLTSPLFKLDLSLSQLYQLTKISSPSGVSTYLRGKYLKYLITLSDGEFHNHCVAQRVNRSSLPKVIKDLVTCYSQSPHKKEYDKLKEQDQPVSNGSTYGYSVADYDHEAAKNATGRMPYPIKYTVVEDTEEQKNGRRNKRPRSPSPEHEVSNHRNGFFNGADESDIPVIVPDFSLEFDDFDTSM